MYRYIHIFLYKRTPIALLVEQIHIYIHTHIYTYICIHIYAYIYTCFSRNIYTYRIACKAGTSAHVHARTQDIQKHTRTQYFKYCCVPARDLKHTLHSYQNLRSIFATFALTRV